MALVNDADMIYKGSTEADAVYKGSNLVWQNGPSMEVFTVTEGEDFIIGKAAQPYWWGYENNNIGSLSPSQLKGVNIIGAVHRDSDYPDNRQFTFIIRLEGFHPKNFFDRALFQGYGTWLNTADLVTDTDSSGVALWAPGHRHVTDRTIYSWAVPSYVSQWEGSGTSTVTLEYTT